MSDTDRTKKLISTTAIAEAKRSSLYRIGYGKPPEQAQWQKGQSGNFKGRPPKPRLTDSGAAPKEVRDAILDSLRQTHRVSDGKGGEKEITRLEALNLRQQKAALDGNPKALEDVLARAERMMADEQRELAVINENATIYQRVCWKEINEAKAAGKPEPTFFVHPDDIVIAEGKRVEFLGPVGPHALAAVRDAVDARDLVIMQAALEDKMFEDDYLKPYDKRRESALLLAVMLNDRLPHRWKLSEIAFILAFDRQLQKSKRQLLKDVYGGWRKRGVDVPRGTVMPPIGQTVEILEKAINLACERVTGRVV